MDLSSHQTKIGQCNMSHWPLLSIKCNENNNKTKKERHVVTNPEFPLWDIKGSSHGIDVLKDNEIISVPFIHVLVGIKHYTSEQNHLLGQSSKWALTRLTHIGLEDFFLASQFPDFLPTQLDGFINNTLRGLLRITTNYIHIMSLSTYLQFSKMLKILS